MQWPLVSTSGASLSWPARLPHPGPPSSQPTPLPHFRASQKLSHSPHRGGLTPVRSKPASDNPANQPFPRAIRALTPSRQPRLRGVELAAAREALERGEVGGLSVAELNAALGLPPPLEDNERLGGCEHWVDCRYYEWVGSWVGALCHRRGLRLTQPLSVFGLQLTC